MNTFWTRWKQRYWLDEQAPSRWYNGFRSLVLVAGAQLILIPAEEMLAWDLRHWAVHALIALLAGAARMQPSVTPILPPQQ